MLTSTAGTIVLVGLDGEVLEEIADDGAFLFGPVWSPDGEWIAFSRATDGPFADVYVSRPDGGEVTQLTDTEANEIVVEWGRRGELTARPRVRRPPRRQGWPRPPQPWT